VVTREKNSPTVAHACRKRRLKWVLGTCGYNWATQSPGDINMETWPSRLGVGRGTTTPSRKKSTVRKPKVWPRNSQIEIEMTAGSPLRRRRSALDYRAI
jgi:hypothetical protein